MPSTVNNKLNGILVGMFLAYTFYLTYNLCISFVGEDPPKTKKDEQEQFVIDAYIVILFFVFVFIFVMFVVTVVRTLRQRKIEVVGTGPERTSEPIKTIIIQLYPQVAGEAEKIFQMTK